MSQLGRFLVENVASCRNARLDSVAPQLGVRSGRRLQGRARLADEDVLGSRKSELGVARGCWAMERWGNGPRPEMKYFSEREYYDIPLDCLRAAELDNVLVAGRCLSAAPGAMTSARVIGTALATGWAAGIAAAFQALGRPLDDAIAAIRQQLDFMNPAPELIRDPTNTTNTKCPPDERFRHARPSRPPMADPDRDHRCRRAAWITSRSGAKSKSCAASLPRWACSAGQGVGMQGRNGRAFVIGALAALGCGAVVMPIHHLLKPDEMSEMLARAPLCAILDDGSGRAPAGESASQVKVPDGVTLRFTRLAAPQVPLAPWVENAAFLRFTSGTTGAAKGVILTQEGVLERTRAANRGLGLTREDRVLWVLPMSYHFFATILLYLEVGCTIVVGAGLPGREHPGSRLPPQATFLYVTPMHVRMLTAESSGRALPPSVKRVMSVSSRLHPQSARDFSRAIAFRFPRATASLRSGLPLMNLNDAAEHPEAVGARCRDSRRPFLTTR